MGLGITWFDVFLAFLFFPILVPSLVLLSIIKIVKWEKEQKLIHKKRYEHYEEKARKKKT
ncbi:hypothetical protein ABE65_017695 [Fictibacillus phosphorivorans]|uniref:Uncharacterized protein n=1 Tax=Fictibacillus phosphorivorans TaxID=1221500 RepID=A0A168W8F0_9BACL|nr:hypothetical protein ABE65_017695 [Fictibacillus phosphorivorans]